MKEKVPKQMLFTLDKLVYAIPLAIVREVVAILPITPLPKVPAYYKGLINIRGQILSIVDLRLKLNMKEIAHDPKSSVIVIVELGDIQLGLIVDSAQEVSQFKPEQIESFTKKDIDAKHDGIVGVAKDNRNDQLVLLLDLMKLFDNSEFKIFKSTKAA
jgi:purine-binding chemotaxis protein CheW